MGSSQIVAERSRIQESKDAHSFWRFVNEGIWRNQEKGLFPAFLIFGTWRAMYVETNAKPLLPYPCDSAPYCFRLLGRNCLIHEIILSQVGKRRKCGLTQLHVLHL